MKPARILIVEDERHITKFLEFILAKEGCETMVAADGAAALKLLGDFEPDGILLDLGLPDMSGLDLLLAMRRDGKLRGSKVIVLSATLYEDLSEQLSAAGALAQCSKPIAPSTVVKLLQSLEILPVAV